MMLLFLLANCQKKAPDSLLTEQAVAEVREFYQLKVYTFATDAQQQTTDTYLKEAFLPRLHDLQIKPVGVFKQRTSAADTVKRTFVLIPFSSMQQFLLLEKTLEKDTAYIAAAENYKNASHDNPPYLRISSTLMRAFKDMPKMQASKAEGPRADRIYELRSYESATESYFKNKVDMFNDGGEIKLFDRLNFNAVFYGEVLSGDRMPNLMYMTTFSDSISRETHWKAFSDAPEWKELLEMPEYQNNVSHGDIYLLYPTEYSDY
jgi:hypothetical protein